MTSLAKRNYLSELRQLNWDFSGETGSDGFAGYHWYPARFVPQVPGILMGYFTEPYERVLDPFCGSGTTLVEAARAGRRSFGIDTNPVAVLMATAKLVAYEDKTYSDYLRDTLNTTHQWLSRFEEWGSATHLDYVPNAVENSGWYEDHTLRELAALWVALEADQSQYSVVGKAAFSAILRSCCSQEKHWGWICDNVKPKSLRYESALTKFIAKANDFGVAARELRRQRAVAGFGASIGPGEHEVVTGPCTSVLGALPDSSVDAVVTSPPYYGVTDYVRSQRLSFLWFGFDFQASRYTETGARFKRKRLTSLSEYLSEMRECFTQIVRVLRDDRVCAIVIGESPNRGAYLVDFESMLGDLGLSIEDRLERRLPKQRSLSSRLFTEWILITRKAH
jgi:DNA modification methylase